MQRENMNMDEKVLTGTVTHPKLANKDHIVPCVENGDRNRVARKKGKHFVKTS